MADFGEPSTWGETVSEFLATQAIPTGPKAKPLDEVELYRKARIKALLDNLEPGWIEKDSMNWLRKSVTDEKGRTSFGIGGDGREKPLARQIKQVYAEILEETGRKPYIAEVMERVTLDKSKTLDNKRVNIKEVLKRANLELTPGMTTQSKETRIAKSGEAIKQTKRVENFLSDTKKAELFEDIRTYRKGVSKGPDATMNIRDFAKYFKEGTKEHVISRQVNRVANEILKLPPHPKKTPQELLDARKVKYDIMKAGDPEGKFKKIPKEPGKHRHHMRMKGMKLADKLIAISPSLADISYLDVVTNSEKLQNFERIRNDLGKELLELRETKPEGWERRVKEINALAKRASKNIPKNLRPHLFFETMDEAGNLKPIGGWKTKAIDPTSTTPFDATTRAVPEIKKEISKTIPSEKPGLWKKTKTVAGKLGLGKKLAGLTGPTGGLGIWGLVGFNPESGMDRASAAGEVALAPAMVRGTEYATSALKNPMIKKLVQRGLNLGMSIPMALRLARAMSPIGWATLAGEGIYQLDRREKEKREAMSPEELQEHDALLGEDMSISAAEGGIMRMPFKKGGMDRRTFLKLFGGLASLPILGKFFKLAGPATKGIEKVIAQSDAAGIPAWFGSLVRRVMAEGEDITQSAGVMERQTVHKSKLPESGTPIEVTQDLTTGDVIVDIGIEKHGFSAGHLGQPIRMELKKGEWVEGAKGKKGVKTKDEFTIEEAEFTGGHPENIKYEESTLNKYGEQGSDLTEVESYAKVKLDKHGNALDVYGKKSPKEMSGLSSGESHGWKTKKGQQQAWAEGRAEAMADDIDIDDVEF